MIQLPISWTTSIWPCSFLGIPPGKSGKPGIRGRPACFGPPLPRAAATPDNTFCAALCWRRTPFPDEYLFEISAAAESWELAIAESEDVPRTLGMPCDKASATPAIIQILII